MKLLRLPANYLQGHLLTKAFLEKVAKTTKKPPKTHVSGGFLVTRRRFVCIFALGEN